MTHAALRRLAPATRRDDATATPERPLRFLLITDQSELPWAVDMLVQVMAPVDVVQVNSLPNALWRLGRERFDSVLLQLGPRNRRAAEACRRHITDVAAIPVLDLEDDPPMSGAAARPREATHDAAHDARASKWPPRSGRRRATTARKPGDLGAGGMC